MPLLQNIFLILSLALITQIHAEKIRDVAKIVGVRENQLIGYGLIVGLNGTGDGTGSFTSQSIANMLESVNVKVAAGDIQSDNVAAVMVTANLPAFARQGDQVDVLVSSIGDASSLEGGTLILTPLKGVDGEIYAIAQGPVSIGGMGSGNHPLAATLQKGAVIERELSYDLYNKKRATLSLKESNFANAVSVQNRINQNYGSQVATAVDPRTIRLNKPENMSMVEFLASVEDVDVDYQRNNRIIIDERTGTVVAGIDITIEPVIITHGELTIKITEEMAQDDGATEIGDNTRIGTNSNTISTGGKKPTVANVTRALQKLGAGPKDIIAILQGIKKSGAIAVDLEII